MTSQEKSRLIFEGGLLLTGLLIWGTTEFYWRSQYKKILRASMTERAAIGESLDHIARTTGPIDVSSIIDKK